MATRNPDCSVPEEASPNIITSEAQALLATTEGVAVFVGFVCFGILFGFCSCYVLLACRSRRSKRKAVTSAVEEGEHVGLGLSEEDYFDDEPGMET